MIFVLINEWRWVRNEYLQENVWPLFSNIIKCWNDLFHPSIEISLLIIKIHTNRLNLHSALYEIGRIFLIYYFYRKFCNFWWYLTSWEVLLFIIHKQHDQVYLWWNRTVVVPLHTIMTFSYWMWVGN